MMTGQQQVYLLLDVSDETACLRQTAAAAVQRAVSLHGLASSDTHKITSISSDRRTESDFN